MSNEEEKNKKTLWGGMGLLGVLALKFKAYLFAAWKVLALVKFSWFISPLITIGVYAMFFGWPFAVAIVLLLFIHEMGHWIWMKALGLEPKAPMFIPGLGAYVAMTKLPPDQATHAWVALAGPLVGGVSSAAFYTWGVYTNNAWLMAAGSIGFFLNLLQLVPAKPLDGGFVIQAVSRWLLIPGTIGLVCLAWYLKSILLLIIAGISAFSLIGQFRRKPEIEAIPPVVQESEKIKIAEKESSQMQPTYTVATSMQTGQQLIPASIPQRIIIALAYISLSGMLAYLYWMSTNELISFLPPKH